MIYQPTGNRRLPTTLEIKGYLQCGKCEDSCPPDKSMRDYQQLDVGLTSEGLQVWCRRHNLNVLHFDFRGTRVLVNSGITKTRER